MPLTVSGYKPQSQVTAAVVVFGLCFGKKSKANTPVATLNDYLWRTYLTEDYFSLTLVRNNFYKEISKKTPLDW